MRKIVLASGSPRRERFLKLKGLDFMIDPSKHKENLEQELKPEHLAMEIAYEKARDVSARHDDALIIGADTIVVVGEKVLGKPRDKNHAVEMLSKLSGRWNRVITGLCLMDKHRLLRDHCTTHVKFMHLRDEDINAYVETDEPLDKAGAYAIQGGAAYFVQEVRGDYQNVMGLPLRLLEKMLKEFGVEF